MPCKYVPIMLNVKMNSNILNRGMIHYLYEVYYEGLHACIFDKYLHKLYLKSILLESIDECVNITM